MNFKDMDAITDRVFKECRALLGCGRKEYAGGGGNAHGNFERLALELDIPRSKALWVLAMKHKDGIASWIRGHKSQRETVAGRINDLIVYLVLLRGMAEEDAHPLLKAVMPGVTTIEIDMEKHRAEVCSGCGCCKALVRA